MLRLSPSPLLRGGFTALAELLTIAQRSSLGNTLAIGGVADHLYVLLSLPATLAVSKAMQLLKGKSSKWLRETFSELRRDGFAWQEGFGAFSIGVSGVKDTVEYIRTQEEYHRQRSFREEVEAFLKKHGFDAGPGVLE
ncbi:MAG: transposase [Verrucomicrobiota bacterium]